MDLNSSSPFFYLTVGQAETLIKKWVSESLKNNEPVPNPAPVFYKREEVCKLLKISLPTLYKYYSSGLIQGQRFGNRILFSQESVNKALTAIPVQKFKR